MSRELDAEVAEKVMGWQPPDKSQDIDKWHESIKGHWFEVLELPRFSTSIADAWLVVEEMDKQQLDISIDKAWNTGWLVQFTNEPFGGPKEFRVCGQGRGDTAPEAICHASLEAVK